MDLKVHRDRLSKSPNLQAIEEYKYSILLQLLGCCTLEQRDFFYNMYGIENHVDLPSDKVDWAIMQAESTIRKNGDVIPLYPYSLPQWLLDRVDPLR